MAVSPLHLDVGLTGPALNPGLPPIPKVWRMQGLVPGTDGFEALSHLAAKGLCGKSQASSGKEGMSSKQLQDFFSDPTLWRDSRRSKPTSQHPDFKHKTKIALWLSNGHKPPWVDWQLASWDVAPESVSTSVQGQGTSGREGNLQVEAGSSQFEDVWTRDAVAALDRLVRRGCHVPNNLFCRLLKRCISNKDLVLGSRIHALVDAFMLSLKSGYELNAFLATHIIRMYASRGRLEEAKQVFTKVTVPNTFIWQCIISAHADQGEPTRAINLYRQMRQTAVKPNTYVYVAVLKACATAADLHAGKEVHADLLGSADEPDIFVGSSLVDMYAKCGSLADARRVFDRLPRKDVVTWTAIIAAYAQHGFGHEALALYSSMKKEGTFPPNRVTFLCLLQACASIGALDQGKELHAQIQQRRLDADIVVGSCLVDMYAKCGSLKDAHRVFDGLPTKNAVTWTAMIAGYAQQGLGQEALAVYGSMLQAGMSPADNVIFSCLLKACTSIGALHEGKKLHSRIREGGLEADLIVGNCLVDMYANCGCLEEARRIFDELPMKDVVTWNALLNGYAQHSCAQTAIQCFQNMQQQGVAPDEVTFVCLLVACSHEGLVKEGQRHFKMMVRNHGIAPTVKHYACMVDLMGRSGHLDDAENILHTMPFQDDGVGWTSLLSACKSHGDIKRGRRCFDQLIMLEPQSAVAYVLVGSIYANAGRWQDVETIERLRKSAGAKKKPAKAFLEVKNRVHEFMVGEERCDVSSKLRSVKLQVEEGGHVPQTELVLKAVSEMEKEDALCGHAEKLALAYGLLNTPDGTTLLVTKNLRMCNDCHSGTKIMSRLEKREIVVRDAHRVHRFVDGLCSCGDRH